MAIPFRSAQVIERVHAGEGDPAEVRELTEARDSWGDWKLHSGKHTKSYGKSLFLMGKSTINGHFQ